MARISFEDCQNPVEISFDSITENGVFFTATEATDDGKNNSILGYIQAEDVGELINFLQNQIK